MPLSEEILIDHIARVCHEANREFCHCLGDYSQNPWDLAEQWQRDSAIAGVRHVWIELKAGREVTPHLQHHAWFEDKIAAGWTYGKVKDPELKTHPCLIEYDELPVEQQAKDALFIGIAKALLNGEIK